MSTFLGRITLLALVSLMAFNLKAQIPSSAINEITNVEVRNRVRLYDSLSRSYHNQGNGKYCLDYLDSIKLAISPLNLDTSALVYYIYLKGNCQLLVGEYESALTNLVESYNWYEKKGNKVQVAKILADLGNLYGSTQSWTKSIESFGRARDAFVELDDQYKTIQMEGNIGVIYAIQGKLDTAIFHYQAVKEMAEQLNDTIAIITAYTNLSQAFYETEQRDSAKNYLSKLMLMYDNMDTLERNAASYMTLGRIYSSEGKYDKALETELIGLGISLKKEDFVRLSVHYSNLHSIYLGLGDSSKAISSLVSMIEALDESYNREKDSKLLELETQFDVKLKEADIEKLAIEKNSIETQKKLYTWLSALGLALVIALLAYLNHIVKFHKTKKMLMAKDLEFERLKQQKMQDDLDRKGRELAKQTLHLIQKNEKLMEFEKEIDHLKNVVAAPFQKELQKIQSNVKVVFNLEKDWEEFSLYFEEVHPSFYAKLIEVNPNITAKEKRLSALIKAQMDSRSIASILGISIDSVKTSRYRLRKKLNLVESDNLNNFIQSL